MPTEKPKHASCEDCQQPMSPGTACTYKRIIYSMPPTTGDPKGKRTRKTFNRVPYANHVRPEPHNCHDCNTPLGGIHHSGCDMERCPICGGQLISCDDGENIVDVLL